MLFAHFAVALLSILASANTDRPQPPRPLHHPAIVPFVVEESAWINALNGHPVRIEELRLSHDVVVSAAGGPIAGFEPTAMIEVVTGRTANGEIVSHQEPVPAVAAIAGMIEGDPASHLFLSRSEAGTFGFVEAFGRRWIISSGPLGAGFETVVYEPAAFPEGTIPPSDWTCQVFKALDEGGDPSPEGGIAGASVCRQMRVAIDTDHELLMRFGGSTTAAAGYVGQLYAAMNEIYQRDVQLHPWICYLRLWATPDDPWVGADIGAELGAFRNLWESSMFSVSRNEAHFLCGRSIGGGVAWLGSLCSPWAYAASCVGGSFPYPLVDNDWGNWDVMVVAHEMGHNCGAPHTHDYTPPIDGCGSNPQDCTAAELNIGTIMSYCHICDGGMSNIQLRFAPGSIQSMQNHLAAISCSMPGNEAAPAAVNDYVAMLSGVGFIDVDFLANDLPVNCQEITVTQWSTSTLPGGQIVHLPGAGPQGRPLLRYTPAPSFAGLDTFTYQIRDTSLAVATGTVVVRVTEPMPPTAPVGDVAGLTARYFDNVGWSVLPDFDPLTPYLSTWVSVLAYNSTGGNFANSTRADNVGAVFEGWINVPSAGWWTLSTDSDDGSALYLDGVQVVLNDGLHGMVKVSGTVPLASGKHALRVEFFEGGGGAGLLMRWSGPNVTETTVPSSALTRGGAPRLGDVNADTLVNALDLAIVLARWGMPGQGDLDGSGAVDGADLGIILSGWTG
ncbi:MAG: M12 family metallo-peptidase [Planctomycetota bacterium]|nr:M12 family metallo-peptidase [Planctomycetota bacterium]